LFTHYWTPSIRHSFLATYGQIDGTTTSKALPFGAVGAYGDATVWNVGTQLAWLPVRNFEIGVEVLYARVEQDIRRGVVGAVGVGQFGTVTLDPATSSSYATREKSGNWTGRMRVERTF
ncbi:MAG: porin, partial [Hyphomicrobiales bacterium]|nr:porin [Hyphomicrobiales bacterium]